MNSSCPPVPFLISWNLGTSWEGEEQVSAVPPSRQVPILPLESPKALGQMRYHGNHTVEYGASLRRQVSSAAHTKSCTRPGQER